MLLYMCRCGFVLNLYLFGEKEFFLIYCFSVKLLTPNVSKKAMVTVRGRQRNKRRGRVSKTTAGKSRRKEYTKKHKVIIQNELVRKNWDKSKTLKENFASMGLVADVNEPYRTTHHKRKTDHVVEEGDVEEYKAVVQQMEVESQSGAGPAIRHYSPAECELWEGMVRDHGTDYKAMARDKRNTLQHTPKQIKRKVEGYLKFSGAEGKTKMGCVG